MDIFEQVLKKAGEDGVIDPRLLHWDAPLRVDGNERQGYIQKLQLPPQLALLPDDVVYDLQKIIENIRLIAESNSLQIIGFTSAIPNQGTSTITALLSLLMSAREKMAFDQIEKPKKSADKQEKKRETGLVLFDSQFRNPSLHKKLGVEQRYGLVEILENETLEKVIKGISGSPLKVVTAGKHENFTLTQNHLMKFSSLLNKLKTRVRFLFLDIPPILSSSEGVALSRLCDGVILVVRAGETRWEVIQEGRRFLEKAGVNLLGGVLNRREYFIPSWAYRNI